jgi:hypothetical protein
MPSWAVTGKLGGGKTLWAVRMIHKYLTSGRPVATNIDIFPEKFLSVLRDQQKFCLYRLPNAISRDDLDAIGEGNLSNDERRNGLLVIDESGVSLNSRTYNDPNRKALVEWFLHARKLGWDLMFIVQSISLIDKQIREAILEYRATCKRMDRLSIPFLVWFGIRIPMPRFHFVIIRYGMETSATIADRDLFRGNDLFSAFNTKQSLMEAGQQAGVYSVLSPWHLRGRYMSRFQLMRVAVTTAAMIGLILGGVLGWFGQSFYLDAQARAAMPEPAQQVVKEPVGMFSKDGREYILMKDGQVEPFHEGGIP